MACVSRAPEPAAKESDERRFAACLAIETEVSLRSDSQFFTGLGGNLSTGGVFVATYRRLPLGSCVVVQIALPEGDVSAEGSVRWVRDESSGAPPGLGIGFDDPLGADAAQRIERFSTLREPLLHDDE